jgi:hypothetical protein
VPPGHQAKVIIEDSSRPDYGGRETSEFFHPFLEFIES